MASPTEDPVLDAIDAVVTAIKANAENNQRIIRRAKQLQSLRRRGLAWGEIVPAEERPLIVEMLRENQERLTAAGSQFRRREAHALRAEGMTLDQIAALFGVTRPRVIALLRQGEKRQAEQTPPAMGAGPGGGRTPRRS